MLGLVLARELHRLSARKVATAEPGRHADGGGLYLVVDSSGAKRWIYMFRWRVGPGAGRNREMGLGSVQSVSLADARTRAANARKNVANRIDPIASSRQAAKVGISFGAFADEVVKIKTLGFRSGKTDARWKRGLETYAAAIRAIPIADIDTDHILSVLRPLWMRIPASAQKVRGFLEAVLDAAKARRLRTGENPARWKGHLDMLLPKPQKLIRGHHRAMDYAILPQFMAQLRQRTGVASDALEFCILNASRSNEVYGARWDEMDLMTKVWTVPAERMKNAREHRVPLSDQAIAVLERAQRYRMSVFVFPGHKEDRPLSVMAFAMLLRRMDEPVTAHGFRSSFRDWAGEKTSFPREVAEAALSHMVGDQTELAYRRGDALEKRRRMMAAWAKYCCSKLLHRDQR